LSESESDCDPAIPSSSKFHDNSITNDSTQCTSHCFKDQEFPFQPRVVHTTKKQGKQNRLCNTQWYRDYKWFSFCLAKVKAFAFYWHKAACNGKLPSGPRIDSTLITTGFDNWKKAKGKFRAHKKSLVHRDALLHTKHAISLLSQPRCLTRFSGSKNTTENFL